MTSRVLGASGQYRTIIAVFDTGDEAMDGLLACARDHGMSAASFTAIGAFESVTLGYFEMARRDYARIRLEEQVEVLTLAGNVAATDQGPKIHAHVVVGRADGTAHGGHLLEARVRPTLEVVIIETPAHLRRKMDPATGLALIDLGA